MLNKVILVTIFNKLDNNDIAKIHRVNKNFKSICDDDHFWMTRLLNQFIDFKIKEVKIFLKFDNWKEYYKYLFSNILISRKDKIKEIKKLLKCFKYQEINIDEIILPAFIDKEKLIISLNRELFFSNMYERISLNENYDNFIEAKYTYLFAELMSSILEIHPNYHYKTALEEELTNSRIIDKIKFFL